MDFILPDKKPKKKTSLKKILSWVGFVVFLAAILLLGYLVITKTPGNEEKQTAPETPVAASSSQPLQQSPDEVTFVSSPKEDTAVPSQQDETDEEAAELLKQANISIAEGQKELAKSLLIKLMRNHPDTWYAKRAYLKLGQIYLDDKDYEQASIHISKGLEGVQSPQEERNVLATLQQLSQKLIFSDYKTENTVFYTVQSGDALVKIANRYDVSPGLIQDINNISNPNMIRVNQRLKIITGDLKIVIHKDTFTLDVFLNDMFMKRFKIGLGKDDGTPLGVFEIDSKEVRPIWNPPGGGPAIPYGNPEYPLGERWLGFKSTTEHSGYGIHGTNEPETIGTQSSMGCIRMHNEDVIQLFKWVKMGTKVHIVK